MNNNQQTIEKLVYALVSSQDGYSTEEGILKAVEQF